MWAARGTSEVSLLGGFVLSVPGDAMVGISAASQRLLAFLAVRDRTVGSRQAAAMLWPESSDERAAASLRSALSHLERPARHAVRVTAGELSLAEGVTVDVRRAQALARRLIDRDAPRSASDIDAAAVSVLSGGVLAGWYEDWAVIAAEYWHQLRVHALEAAAARLAASGRLAEAATAARAAVQAEPLRESARAALISVRLADGDWSEALDEFERYRMLLRAELGLEPTSRLGKLVSDVGTQ